MLLVLILCFARNVVKWDFFCYFQTKNREITRADIEFWEFLNLSSIAKKKGITKLMDNLPFARQQILFPCFRNYGKRVVFFLREDRADDLAHNQSPLWRQKEKVKENCKSSKPSLFLQSDEAFFLPGFWEDVSSSSLFICAVPPSWWSGVLV